MMKASSVFWILLIPGILVQSLFTIVFFMLAKHYPQLHKVDWIPVLFLGALCAAGLRLANYLIKK